VIFRILTHYQNVQRPLKKGFCEFVKIDGFQKNEIDGFEKSLYARRASLEE